MLKTLFNKLLMLIYFVVGALVLEFITFNVLSLGTLPEYFMLNLALIMIIGLIVYCIPNFTAQYVIYTIILIVQAVFIYVNYSLLFIYKDLFSFDMFNLIKEAQNAMTSNFVYFKIIFQLVVVVLAIAVAGLFILNYCKKEKINIKQHFSIFNIILLLSIQFLSCGYYVHMRNYINDMSDLTDEKYTESDAFLMNTNFLKTTSYNKFGTYGYMVNLLFNSFSRINEAHKKATINYFKSGNTYTGSEFLKLDDEQGQDNVIIIMMESLEWFAFGDGSYDKNYNNLSKELTPNVYNIIYGLDASPNTNDDAIIFKNFFAKSKTNISEGYGVLGNYPVGQSLTSFAGDGYNKNLNAFGYSLPNMLNSEYITNYVHSNVIDFYSRNETHNNLGFKNIYGKGDILDSNGNPIYSGDELEWGNWAAEGDFARNAIDYLVPYDENTKQPFFTFYLNVSSHGSYLPEKNDFDGDALRYHDYVKYGQKNCNLVDKSNNFFYDGDEVITDVDTLEKLYPKVDYFWRLNSEKWNAITKEEDKYSSWFYNVLKNYGTSISQNSYKENALTEKLIYYECGAVGLDEAIGVIVDKLIEDDIYDKTTLLLYADHYAYYDGVSNNVKGFQLNDTASVELNTIPMIISSPKLKRIQTKLDYSINVNERFCSAYDIIPTILDLLNIPFNENFYIGQSIFKPADYVYVLDAETGLARQPNDQEFATEMFVYYSNTGGFFSKDCYSIDLKLYYDRIGNTINDEYLTKLFKSQATKVLTKLNYLQLLNTFYLYNQI